MVDCRSRTRAIPFFIVCAVMAIAIMHSISNNELCEHHKMKMMMRRRWRSFRDINEVISSIFSSHRNDRVQKKKGKDETKRKRISGCELIARLSDSSEIQRATERGTNERCQERVYASWHGPQRAFWSVEPSWVHSARDDARNQTDNSEKSKQ